MVTERVLQAWMIKKLHRLDHMVFKQSAESQAGLPDLVVWPPDGPAFMIEVKTLTGRLSKIQVVMIDRLRAHGVVVHVLNSKEAFNAIFDPPD